MSFGRSRGPTDADSPAGRQTKKNENLNGSSERIQLCCQIQKNSTLKDCSSEYKVSTLAFFIMTFIGMNIIFDMNIMFIDTSKFHCGVVLMSEGLVIYAVLKCCGMQDTFDRIMEHFPFVIFLQIVIMFFLRIVSMFN
jgi:hypothetical protein